MTPDHSADHYSVLDPLYVLKTQHTISRGVVRRSLRSIFLGSASRRTMAVMMLSKPALAGKTAVRP